MAGLTGHDKFPESLERKTFQKYPGLVGLVGFVGFLLGLIGHIRVLYCHIGFMGCGVYRVWAHNLSAIKVFTA